MRMAQRPIRCVVADRPHCLGRDAARQGPRKSETGHGGDALEKNQRRSIEESIRGTVGSEHASHRSSGEDAVEILQEFVDNFTYLGVFVVLLLGSVGVPEEMSIIAAAVLSHEGIVRWWLALPVCMLGALSGDGV